MGNASKRVEGAVEELGGRVKAGLGKALGNEQMEAEGHAQRLKGEAKQEAAKASERVKGAIEETKGALKGKLGELTDNEQWEAEGRASEIKGQVRRDLNQ